MTDINYVKLEECATKLTGLNREIKDLADDMNSNLFSKIGIDGEDWGGEAAETARQTLNQLYARLMDVVSIIDADVKNINTVVANYKNVDQTFGQVFNQ